MQKWDHQVSDMPQFKDPLDEQLVINDQGIRGWELIAARSVGYMVRYYFKRPLQEAR